MLDCVMYHKFLKEIILIFYKNFLLEIILLKLQNKLLNLLKTNNLYEGQYV